MSASHRSIARLPLELFTDLRPEQGDAEALRGSICSKLKRKQGKSSVSVTTVGQLLKLSPPALLRTLDPILCNDECQELVRRISLHGAPSPTSALDLLQGTSSGESSEAPRHYLQTGMPSLDSILRGGFRVGTISELVGRAGVGKSQLALQLCIMAAKYNKATVYIDTEKKLSLARLKEMAEEKCGRASQQQDEAVQQSGAFSYGGGGGSSLLTATQGGMEGVSDFYGVDTDTNYPFKSARDVLANTTVHTATSTHELLSLVSGIEEEVLYRNEEAQEDSTKFPVGLLVLDSVAAPTRRDFGSESAMQRVSAVLQLAQVLKRLADQLQLVVIVINQVELNNELNDIQSSQGTDLVQVKAALGTAWSHCLSTRLFLEHERDPHRLNSTVDEAQKNVTMDGDFAWKHERGHVRKATVVKSNVAGEECMNYEIRVDGLEEIRLESDGQS